MKFRTYLIVVGFALVIFSGVKYFDLSFPHFKSVINPVASATPSPLTQASNPNEIPIKPATAAEASLSVSPDGSTHALLTYNETEINNQWGFHKKGQLLELIVRATHSTGQSPLSTCEWPKNSDPWQNPTSVWQKTLMPDDTYFGYLELLYKQELPTAEPLQPLLVWSNDNSKLAFWSPDGLQVYSFSSIPSSTDTKPTCQLQVHYIPNQMVSPSHPDHFLFSADSSELYISRLEPDASNLDSVIKVYRYSLETQQLDSFELPRNAGTDIYALPTGKGVAYAYHQYSQNIDLPSTQVIVVDRFTNKKMYEFPTGSDFVTNVVFSPDYRYVCVGEAASGGRSYKIFKTTHMDNPIISESYSYCGRWLNGDEIIIDQLPYAEKINTTIKLTVSTQKTTFLSAQNVLR